MKIKPQSKNMENYNLIKEIDEVLRSRSKNDKDAMDQDEEILNFWAADFVMLL